MGKANILIAYPYLNDKMMMREASRHADQMNILVDSGAFTAWKAGTEIRLADYMRFIEKLPFEPWRYFALDVIGDPHGTMKNYREMLRCGFKPVPVFTRGERPEILEEYYETSDLVAVGGLVGTKANKGYVNGFMRLVNGRKTHWLGFTDQRYIQHWKPYCCDSSSAESGARYGSLRLYLGSGKWANLQNGCAKSRRAINTNPHIRYALEYYGLNTDALKGQAAWSGGESNLRYLSIASSIRWSFDLSRHVGTRAFLALTTVKVIHLIARSLDELQKKGYAS